MFNNPAIDIAIGLIFIYALYSLITTTFTELINSWLNLRGKVLRTGIKRMLDDQENKTVNSEILSQTFLARPEYKYLGKKSMFTGKSKLPSYLKPKTFAKTLLSMLDELFDSKKNMSVIKNKLNSDSPSQQYLIRLIEETENNREAFKTAIEEWYCETMERVSGWYKKKAQLVSFVIGLLIAFSLNLNTIEIAKRLGRDEQSGIALVQAASSYVESYRSQDAIPTERLEKIDALTTHIDDLLKDTKTVVSILDIKYPDTEKDSPSWFNYIFGCFLTAIALSVGSPFWFDLLNKLIQLRGAGVQEKNTLNHLSPPKKQTT
ncbi:hypothetical protein [Saccharicrinis fermentans]|uniref:Uncharacterized protein n=1 Tax=Saccharicrinis fermentans DSM 9555 = JCM 21142 TaxID=869213 RepID=W7Y8Q5_9BACT|nr:hypothetical protein [Saccharicrinis fermentans]GAF04612.1 hypothetical protein JCM21142_93324 [Saccharicrinis fermentans DSM 9555 = JCM 21142]